MQEQNVIENMKNIRKNKNSENEIAVTGKSGIFWLKGAGWFTCGHAGFHDCIAGWWHPSLSHVTASAPSSGKIEHTVMALGTVEAGGEKAIVTEEGILVAQSMCIREKASGKEKLFLHLIWTVWKIRFMSCRTRSKKASA